MKFIRDRSHLIVRRHSVTDLDARSVVTELASGYGYQQEFGNPPEQLVTRWRDGNAEFGKNTISLVNRTNHQHEGFAVALQLPDVSSRHVQRVGSWTDFGDVRLEPRIHVRANRTRKTGRLQRAGDRFDA